MRASPAGFPEGFGRYVEAYGLGPPYDRVAALARRLARGQPTVYDVVRSIQSHLRTEYAYNEHPPRRALPLVAFLLKDRLGYCQHFSGAMALMLRMLGIPTRVAAGFTPGSYNADTHEYRVRDLDAHSWVEVWFDGVGWVPFDPTPSVAPADSQSGVNDASASGGAAGADERQDSPKPDGAEAPAGAGGGESSESGGPALGAWAAVAALIVAALAALAVLGVRARGRRPHGLEAEEAEIAALVRVLARSGEPATGGLTLRRLEARLEHAAAPEATQYARMLRERRYAPSGGPLPDGAARRQLRRALMRGRGLRARVAALAAMPPVSFRRG
jgi:hypothetical protein